MERNAIKVGQRIKVTKTESVGDLEITKTYTGPVNDITGMSPYIVTLGSDKWSYTNIVIDSNTQIDLVEDVRPEPGWYLWKKPGETQWRGAVHVNTKVKVSSRVDETGGYSIESYFGSESDFVWKKVSD